jgi:hypothetical protein
LKIYDLAGQPVLNVCEEDHLNRSAAIRGESIENTVANGVRCFVNSAMSKYRINSDCAFTSIPGNDGRYTVGINMQSLMPGKSCHISCQEMAGILSAYLKCPPNEKFRMEVEGVLVSIHRLDEREVIDKRFEEVFSILNKKRDEARDESSL